MYTIYIKTGIYLLFMVYDGWEFVVRYVHTEYYTNEKSSKLKGLTLNLLGRFEHKKIIFLCHERVFFRM